MSKNYWLMKTEPETYSFEHLVSKPGRIDRWEGVRNYQARNMMRDLFQCGDLVFVYHSSTAEPGIVGIAEIVRSAYPDPTALDPESAYFDAKSLAVGASRWVMVDVKAQSRFEQTISLKRLRGIESLAGMALLRPGQRLSVQPVTAEEWQTIVAMEASLPLKEA